MGKLSELIANLNSVSKNVLKYGFLIGIIFLIIADLLLKNADSISELSIAREFFSENVYALCEVVIGALLLDMMIVKDDKD